MHVCNYEPVHLSLHLSIQHKKTPDVSFIHVRATNARAYTKGHTYIYITRSRACTSQRIQLNYPQVVDMVLLHAPFDWFSPPEMRKPMEKYDWVGGWRALEKLYDQVCHDCMNEHINKIRYVTNMNVGLWR